MIITAAHENCPQYRQIEEGVKNSPLMRFIVPDGSALTDNVSSAEIARYQSGIIICCKNSHGHEERFRRREMVPYGVQQQII